MKYFSFRLFDKDFSFNDNSTCVGIKYLNLYLDYFLMQNDLFKDVIIDGGILYFVEKNLLSHIAEETRCVHTYWLLNNNCWSLQLYQIFDLEFGNFVLEGAVWKCTISQQRSLIGSSGFMICWFELIVYHIFTSTSQVVRINF